MMEICKWICAGGFVLFLFAFVVTNLNDGEKGKRSVQKAQITQKTATESTFNLQDSLKCSRFSRYTGRGYTECS